MTHLDPDNITELAVIAREVGAEVLSGHLRYPSDTGGWQLGDVDLSEYLAQHRDRRLVLIVAPLSDAEPVKYASATRRVAINRAEPCPGSLAETGKWVLEYMRSRSSAK